MSRVLLERARILDQLLPTYFRNCTYARGVGSTSYWVTCPPGCDATELATAARVEGVLIEPGDVFSMSRGSHARCFRLGFSSIRNDRISPGIERLGRLILSMS